MAAIEFSEDRQNREPATDFGHRVFVNCRKRGLEAISSQHILRIAPPLNISRMDLEKGLELLEDSIRDVEGAWDIFSVT